MTIFLGCDNSVSTNFDHEDNPREETTSNRTLLENENDKTDTVVYSDNVITPPRDVGCSRYVLWPLFANKL